MSIFAILIFQSLFILFALSLNVALVVHDKINLQNSVDLSAYYGAMKQAEMMNAIAHINFQIRQSFKLLSWRYRVLGSMGLTGSVDIPNSESLHNPVSGGFGPYFFCLGHNYWGGMLGGVTPTQDDLCKNIRGNIEPLFIPRVGGTLGRFGDSLRNMGILAGQINANITEVCRAYGATSWVFGALAFMFFRKDQSDRKWMIHELAKKLQEGKDLDNEYIKDGVEKTFVKNLTYINRTAYDNQISEGTGIHIQTLNSLEGQPPEYWLKDHPFKEQGLYSDFTGPTRGGCKKRLSPLTNPSVEVNPGFVANIMQYMGVVTNDWTSCSGLCESSAGLSKNKDHLVYYGVKAEIDYKGQVFLPFLRNTGIKLKARAYAKPFGGRIGPPPEADKYSLYPANNPLDTTIPPAQVPSYIEQYHAPNYPRYPGDQLGLKSAFVHYVWINYLRANKIYNRIFDYFPRNNQDPLAWSETGTVNTPNRLFELIAVSPDLFDIAYFTILPYYQQAYFRKIRRLLENDHRVRGDLGVYFTGGNFNNDQSLLNQVGYDIYTSYQRRNIRNKDNIWERIKTISPAHNTFEKSHFFYKAPDLRYLLTGWNPPKANEKYADDALPYDRMNTKFAKCDKWVHDFSRILSHRAPIGRTAIGCLFGGRTGYSVKLISHKYLERYWPQFPR